ncbi:MAG: hypothetical protein PHY69_07420 [Dysgonamonadaceae bacterium]|nr:hypothetical protein [Dysgonamonadaceae bacterium]
MKKSYFFKFFVIAVIAAFVTITSCKDYDDDINKLNTALDALKTEAVAKSELTALQTQLQASISAVQTDLTAAKARLTTLETNGATKAQLDAAKAEILAATVKLDTYNAFKASVDADILKLKADVAKAATKEELTALQTLHNSSLAALKLELGAQIANLEAVLKADILANKTEIAAVKADLQAKYDELSAEIETLKTDLANVTANLAALDQRVTAVRQEMATAIADLSEELQGLIFDVYNSLDKRVTALTFIPDYTSEDGTPQIIVRGITEWEGPKYRPAGTPKTDVYWEEILEDGTIYKGITILRYNVSPSNASMSDFEIANLLNKTTLVRSLDTKSDYVVLSGDATYADGVLSVPVAVEVNTYDFNDGSWDWGLQAKGPRHDNVSIALQVRNLNAEYDNEEDRLVTSTEYVKANFDLSDGRIALNDKSEKEDGTQLPYDINATNISLSTYAADIKLWNGKAQPGATTGDVLNHTINLNDYIYGVFDEFFGGWSEMKEFGFNDHTFKFRLVSLSSEGTDQSMDYVTLNETTGVIGVKPAGSLVNAAAVGRTPVVEVTAVVNGKVHAVGFIKIIVTDNFDKSPVPFTFTLEDYTLGCNSTYSLTNVDINAIDFDQIFNHARIQLGKDAFFTEYSQSPVIVELISAPANATLSHVTFTWAIDPETQSANLFNYLKGEISNTAPAGTYKVKTTLKSNGYRPDVAITWNFKVKLPTYSLTANSAILSGGKIVVNPTIQEQGGKTSAAYEALLNNAFMHQSGSFIFSPLPPACTTALTPYFVFASAPSGYVVSDDLTQLYLAGHKGDGAYLAAVIVQEGGPGKFIIRLNNNAYDATPWGNYAPLSAAARGLVGKSVSVQPRGYINGMTYNWINLFNPFNVEFVYPLQLILPTNASVYDQANNGLNTYAFNPYDPTVALIDWNGAEININTEPGRDLIDHYEVGQVPVAGIGTTWIPAMGHFPGTVSRPGYTGWWWAFATPSVTYSSPFVFDITNAKCNINGSGDIVSDINYPIPAGMQLKYGVVNAAGSVEVLVNGITYNLPTTYAFTWVNEATGAVQNEFKVSIPVSVSHKWGILRGNLVIKVKPGSGNE